MIRVTREEGHYTLKRVKKLPKRGNHNLLYHIKKEKNVDIIDKLYRYLNNGTYEEIQVGEGSSIFQATNLTLSSSNVLEATFADGSVQNVDISSIFETTQITFNSSTQELEITFTDGSTGTINLLDILEFNLSNAPVYNSINSAIGGIGIGKLFTYSEDNLDGVPSPNNSIIGITKN